MVHNTVLVFVPRKILNAKIVACKGTIVVKKIHSDTLDISSNRRVSAWRSDRIDYFIRVLLKMLHFISFPLEGESRSKTGMKCKKEKFICVKLGREYFNLSCSLSLFFVVLEVHTIVTVIHMKRNFLTHCFSKFYFWKSQSHTKRAPKLLLLKPKKNNTSQWIPCIITVTFSLLTS